MGEAREFPNPYLDFGSRTDLTDGLETDFASSLKECQRRLLRQLQEGLSKAFDVTDNSIYTGTCGFALLYRKMSQTSSDEKERRFFKEESLHYIR